MPTAKSTAGSDRKIFAEDDRINVVGVPADKACSTQFSWSSYLRLPGRTRLDAATIVPSGSTPFHVAASRDRPLSGGLFFLRRPAPAVPLAGRANRTVTTRDTKLQIKYRTCSADREEHCRFGQEDLCRRRSDQRCRSSCRQGVQHAVLVVLIPSIAGPDEIRCCNDRPVRKHSLSRSSVERPPTFGRPLFSEETGAGCATCGACESHGHHA